MLTEVGWPSDGRIKRGAVPDESNQARFLREFLNIARTKKIDYHIMEAFDQPWKRDIEGGVGAYWGIFDAERRPKFALAGPIIETPEWPFLSALAVIIALIPSLCLATLFMALLPKRPPSAGGMPTPLPQNVLGLEPL